MKVEAWTKGSSVKSKPSGVSVARPARQGNTSHEKVIHGVVLRPQKHAMKSCNLKVASATSRFWAWRRLSGMCQCSKTACKQQPTPLGCSDLLRRLRLSPSPFDNRHAESPAARLELVPARVIPHSHQEVRLDGEKCSSTKGRFGSLWCRFASKASEVEAGLGIEARRGAWLGISLR